MYEDEKFLGKVFDEINGETSALLREAIRHNRVTRFPMIRGCYILYRGV